MDNCLSEQQLQDLYRDIEEELAVVGFMVPGFKFKRTMISVLKSSFIEYQVSSCREELDQFIRGLDTHQVLSLLRQDDNKKKARGLFSGQVKPLTVMGLRQLLQFNYGEENKRHAEMSPAQGFLTFLQAASKKKDSEACVNGILVNLEDVLMWLMGARQIPATGFHKKIDVEFKNSVNVNTCA